MNPGGRSLDEGPAADGVAWIGSRLRGRGLAAVNGRPYRQGVQRPVRGEPLAAAVARPAAAGESHCRVCSRGTVSRLVTVSVRGAPSVASMGQGHGSCKTQGSVPHCRCQSLLSDMQVSEVTARRVGCAQGNGTCVHCCMLYVGSSQCCPGGVGLQRHRPALGLLYVWAFSPAWWADRQVLPGRRTV